MRRYQHLVCTLDCPRSMLQSRATGASPSSSRSSRINSSQAAFSGPVPFTSNICRRLIAAHNDRLAEERRPGRESEADGDKPRSWSILTHASIPQYEALAHPLPARPLPIQTSGLSKSQHPPPHRPPLPSLTRTHRCGSSHASCRGGVEA
jgi:hypothetical protein